MSEASRRHQRAAYVVPPPRAMPATGPTPIPSSVARVPVQLRPVVLQRTHPRILRRTSSHIVQLESAKWNITKPSIEKIDDAIHNYFITIFFFLLTFSTFAQKVLISLATKLAIFFRRSSCDFSAFCA
ncbi:hypothetical protein ALC62_13768 [Cyphomyrmex costatus]|uniref:Uncharacterized protein n=1 Tax=Cyphomyrmex costatus TaxID=456900 RepID=A0A195C667_9HYME|nr:hypothetical protein ALC62_13768 [Cyphomyrmex costatus]